MCLSIIQLRRSLAEDKFLAVVHFNTLLHFLSIGKSRNAFMLRLPPNASKGIP
jgi:hypothetical protein